MALHLLFKMKLCKYDNCAGTKIYNCIKSGVLLLFLFGDLNHKLAICLSFCVSIVLSIMIALFLLKYFDYKNYCLLNTFYSYKDFPTI